MTQVADKLAMIDRATERANAPRSSKKPVFLFLSEGQKALVRPMFNLSQALVLAKHNKWSENRENRVNAVCAKEIGKLCDHCDSAKVLEDKKLQASDVFFLPVYVYSVIEVRTGQKVTFKEKDEHDKEVEKPVSGFRVLELPLFGRAFTILQNFRAYVRDEESHDITVCDFSIEQMGAGQGKSFIVTPKAPKPAASQMVEKCPAIERFQEAILAACPPVVLTTPQQDAEAHFNETGQNMVIPAEGNDYDF